MNNNRTPKITAVILAGGMARRMGGQDKGLIDLDGRPLIAHVLERIQPQVDQVVINANRNLEQYARFGHPVISDTLSDFQGPLAGFLAVMQQVDTDFIATLPCDGPCLPDDLIERLRNAQQAANADIAVAHDGNRMQPVYALIATHLRPSLEAFLQAGERKIDWWYAKHNTVNVDFSDAPDTFLNINTPEDRERYLAGKD
ncbi:molybdenum cofactor guanylyltransferase MobA [Sedimenticola selenatireducens]|uniref:Molybdenum cofactor guanylyltransferase n=1 Tax=Sedimenticola selenatireducens TaxID=191960 RepID=A0A557S0R0_9GAMM|nr:molybdenum cofactor guanylyltransferase MobA [Sedimenticola selenatireducens]TVO70938.1 molybdenum cofactor guanylyltransferase [Sedimenticola selenatireducens]TVT65804.1 MAG: molybdenum cofactor guanylyltransferase [Sedimenticola selenatireducens]